MQNGVEDANPLTICIWSDSNVGTLNGNTNIMTLLGWKPVKFKIWISLSTDRIRALNQLTVISSGRVCWN